MTHNQLKLQILQMLTDANPAQVERMTRAQTLEPLLTSLMADYVQSEDSERHAAIDRHVLKPDVQELSYQFLMIQREALQQVSERINAITGFNQESRSVPAPGKVLLGAGQVPDPEDCGG